MKLIFIYGLPATGKLTIAREIEKRTNYRVLHNHDIIDVCFTTLDSKTKRFWPFARKLRLDLIKEAIKQEISGLIMTMAYTGESDFIWQIMKLVEKEGSKFYLIKLTCDMKTLEKRVYDKSRKKYGKLKTKAALKGWFDKYGDITFPGKKSFVLDTSKLSAKQVADRIIKWIG